MRIIQQFSENRALYTFIDPDNLLESAYLKQDCQLRESLYPMPYPFKFPQMGDIPLPYFPLSTNALFFA